MKKILMFLLMPLLFSPFVSINAQVTPGIKGGINSASLTGFDGNKRISAHAGFFLHNTINRNWCFQPELIYSGEGQLYFADGEERKIALDYLQMPLMIQFFPIQQFYLEFGPQLGLLASAQDKNNFGDNINVRDDFTKAQIGFNVGMGLFVAPNIGFYGRYNMGLTDVSRFDNIVDQSRVGQVGIMIRLHPASAPHR